MRRIWIVLCMSAFSTSALAEYSAIAIAPSTGAWGVSNNLPTQVEAEQKAVEDCKKYSSAPADCRSVTWAKGGWCAAVSMHHTADRAVAWGAVGKSTLAEAQSSAKDICTSYVHDGGECDDNTVHVCSR